MFDTLINRLFPTAMAGGLVIYAVVTLIWLQPLVESRMAEKFLVPACEAGLQISERSTPEPVNPRRTELETYIRVMEASGMDQIPGMQILMQQVRAELRALKTSRRSFSNIERNTTCGCAVNRAYEAINFPQMLLHVASARTYNPTQVQRRTLEQSTLQYALSGQCGSLPWK